MLSDRFRRRRYLGSLHALAYHRPSAHGSDGIVRRGNRGRRYQRSAGKARNQRHSSQGCPGVGGARVDAQPAVSVYGARPARAKDSPAEPAPNNFQKMNPALGLVDRFFLDRQCRIKALFIRFNTPVSGLNPPGRSVRTKMKPRAARLGQVRQGRLNLRRAHARANGESVTMKSHRLLLQIVLLVVTFCGAAWAQTGSITGTVKDSSGAAVSGATVVVTSPERGITRKTTSNSTGEYNESALAPGSYDVIVTATGFKKYEAKGVILDVGEKARVDVPLEVGATSTEVIVQGENVAQVETQSSELAGTVTGKEITQLELNGRNFTTLVTLVPGVSNQTGMDEPQVGINGSVAFSMNGGRVEYNNWELDGGDNMDNGSNGTLNVYPSVDAISEFKVLTSNYGAQYGRNGSGTVEVETKGGTKEFHGDLYEFVRNDAFNADNFFNSTYRGGSGAPPDYKKNDFGYTIGGPVYIPGLYNQK